MVAVGILSILMYFRQLICSIAMHLLCWTFASTEYILQVCWERVGVCTGEKSQDICRFG